MKYINPTALASNLKMFSQPSSSESTRVSWQLVQGFLIGSYLAAFSVGSTSLFLVTFVSKTDMSAAILASGVVGIFITSLFTYFQSRISFSRLAIGTILIITCVTVLFFVGIHYWEAQRKNLIFAAFVCVIPFNTILLLIFWGVFGILFNLRESKRIIGRIDTGQQVASIFSLVGIRFTLSLMANDPSNLFIICTLSIFLLLITLFIVRRKYDLQAKTSTVQTSSAKPNIKQLFSKKYILLLSSFVIVSSICITFINYLFNVVTAEQYKDASSLANFLSIFGAIIVVLGFLIQTLATDRIIYSYGIKIALLINPLLVILLSIIAFLTGSLLGYTSESKVFIFFSLAISLSRLIATSLKDALDSPAFKLYFLPLEQGIRLSAQFIVEGVVTATASLLAGGILLAINYWPVVTLIYVNFLLIPITVLWFYIGLRMYSEYRFTLEGTLKKLQQIVRSEKIDKKVNVEELGNWQDNNLSAVYNVQVIQKVEPGQLKNQMINQTRKNSSEMRDYGLGIKNEIHYEPSSLSEKKRVFIKRNNIIEASKVIGDKEFINLNLNRLERFAKSKIASERLYAAKNLSKTINDNNVDILISLLKDRDIDVKKAAIHTARKVQKDETWSILINEMVSNDFRHEAIAALIEAGENILDTLEINFHRANQSRLVRLMIIQIYGRIGSLKAIDLLWKKIEYPDKNIVEQVLYALSYCNFTAKDEKARTIIQMIETEIGYASWNQAALTEISDTPYNFQLIQALKEELKYNFDTLFQLLSLVYDVQSVALVRENVESEISENKVYAIELLDIFISKSLKPMLFPLLDDLSVSERMNQLQSYYPRKKLDSIEVLEHIINSDFNHLNRWTKACAIYSLAQTSNAPVNNTLLAHLFNPEELLRETAAYAVRRKDKALYYQISERVNEKLKRDLERVFEPINISKKLDEEKDPKILLIIEKVFFLKEVKDFVDTSGLILTELVTHLKYYSIKNADTIIADSLNFSNSLCIVKQGELMLLDKNEAVYLVKEKEMFGDIFNQIKEVKIEYLTATSNAQLYFIDKKHIFEMMARHPHFAKEMSKIIKNRTLSYYIYEN